jgi:ParB family transcriptional regulator, chromosome partitioning protein
MSISAVDSKRRALGKGLDSLLPRVQTPATAPAAVHHATESEGGKPREIPVKMIDPNPYQTRGQIDQSQLGELAASIAANGVVQPILVRPQANGRFQLIAGERRWRASELINKETIPAILRQVSDEQAMEITIVENLQRADLNPMEQARAFDRLSREFNMTQEQMGIRTGKDRASIANFLRLLRLPLSVQNHIETGELSIGHAKALLGLPNQAGMEKVAEHVLKLSLSVRQTETYVQGIMFPEPRKKEPKPEVVADPNIREVAEKLQRALGLKVHIEDKNGRGRVIIEYADLADFDGLLEQLAG